MNHLSHLSAVILSACVLGFTALFPTGAEAQFTQQFALQNSPEYEAEATRLRGAPPREYDFSKALLSDVLRFLADDAGISFFGLPEGSENADRLVTFSLRTSPFTALETLAKANGIALIHDNGLWYLRPADDTELIGRVYQINYNSQELVTKNSQSSGTGISGGSSSGGGGSSGGSGGGLSLQGATNNFEREPSKLIEDIKEILNLPTNSRFATIAPTASVDTLGQLSAASISGRQSLVAPVAVAGEDGGSSGGSDETGPIARVIWNSDSNTLYVVATRQQHQWIEGYLASADQMQSLIAVEVKFFESNKDPRSELGIDWTGTLGGGYGANLAIPPHGIDLNRIKDYRLPTTSVLSYDDVNLRLRALVDDRHTRTVSYPRMLTLDNREVVFRSVINQPVLASSSASSLGAGATETTAVDYLPIGTVINILPKRMSGDNILLNVSLEVSEIIGEEIINGNPFPIATSRVYGAPVQVESGYTVAISGLDKAQDVRAEEGVPFLRRIPLLGYAFKTRREQDARQHLMIFITPTILDTNDEGITETPVSMGPNDPSTGPAVEEFAPTIMQFAESARPVPSRSRRAYYPDGPDAIESPALTADPAPVALVDATPQQRVMIEVPTGQEETAATDIAQASADSDPAIAAARARLEARVQAAADAEQEAKARDEATALALAEYREKAQAAAAAEAQAQAQAQAEIAAAEAEAATAMAAAPSSAEIAPGAPAAAPSNPLRGFLAAMANRAKSRTNGMTEQPSPEPAPPIAEEGVVITDAPAATSAEVADPVDETVVADVVDPVDPVEETVVADIADPVDEAVVAAPVAETVAAIVADPFPDSFADPFADPVAETVADNGAAGETPVIEWDGDQLKGGTAAIDGAMAALRGEIADISNTSDSANPTLQDARRIATVQKQSQKLIDYVESQKHNDPNAFEDLNEAWWDLVRINGQSKKLRRSAIDASGVAAVDEFSTEE